MANSITKGFGICNIAAPGVGILSTLPGSAYGTASGTSFATPLVASLLSRYVGTPAVSNNIPAN